MPAARTWLNMDFQGQKMAERLMLYIICIAGLVAFCMGWLEGSFALMMKVRATSIGTSTAICLCRDVICIRLP